MVKRSLIGNSWGYCCWWWLWASVVVVVNVVVIVVVTDHFIFSCGLTLLEAVDFVVDVEGVLGGIQSFSCPTQATCCSAWA